MSPERIRNQPYSYSSDMWSLGLTLVESATGHYPYQIDANSSGIEMVQTIIESEAPSLPPGRYLREFEEFVGSCLHKDPHKRLSAEMLLGSRWLQQNGAVGFAAAVENVRTWISSLSGAA